MIKETTKRLNDGTLVAARYNYDGTEVNAWTYANRTQAKRAAERLGGEVIQRGRPFYVKLEEHHAKQVQK
uniref:Uncharacterized protein n=1 Tax=viral metagenome TaxID=1070528 RepID=A0A6M3KHT1_9ZZZZ